MIRHVCVLPSDSVHGIFPFVVQLYALHVYLPVYAQSTLAPFLGGVPAWARFFCAAKLPGALLGLGLGNALGLGLGLGLGSGLGCGQG